MTWFLIVLCVLLLLDSLRLRGRSRSLAVLPASAPKTDDAAATNTEVVLVKAPDVLVSADIVRDGVRHMDANGIDVLDLFPARLPPMDALGVVQSLDPVAYRSDRFGPGKTAVHALLVRRDVLERSGYDPEVQSVHAFLRLARRIKRYACTTTDVAVAAGLEPARRAASTRYGILVEVLGIGAWGVLLLQLVFAALLWWAALAAGPAGWALLAIYHLQPAIALLGTSWKPDPAFLAVTALGRTGLDVWTSLLLSTARRPAELDAPARALRPKYADRVAAGTGDFFESRRTTCPLCEGAGLATIVRVSDQLQHKPGRFHLDECSGCGHIFQNPRLSLAGLDFYYGDFYDGLGEDGLEALFGYSDEPYHARARLMEGRGAPEAWLDVGTGHGHFCCAARDLFPETRFDGLDLSDSIEDAVRRGWIDNGYRGLFPELADEHAGRYDVVSMSHYLEHVREPEQEIEAAAKVVGDQGWLLIEVPDPECRLGRILGRWWLPWFQPQHQHLLSIRNLGAMLGRHGFSPVVWHRGEAHQSVDFLALTVMMLGKLAGRPGEPWVPAGGPLARLRQGLVWLLGAPFVVLGLLADKAMAGLFRRPGWSNTYRVLARRGT